MGSNVLSMAHYMHLSMLTLALRSWLLRIGQLFINYSFSLNFQLMCFVNMALVVSTSPVPQQRPPHHQQRRPSGPFSFLENFFNSTMRFFSNSTFGSSSTNNRQSALRQLHMWSFRLMPFPSDLGNYWTVQISVNACCESCLIIVSRWLTVN